MSVEVSSRFLSAFFVLLMLGRLLGAMIVERFDYLRVVACALVATAGLLVAGLFADARLVYLLPLSGFTMSIVFPTITAAVSKLHPVGTGTILGVLFACGGVGGALGPWIVGLVSQQSSLQLGLATTLLFDAVALIGLACVWHSPTRVRTT